MKNFVVNIFLLFICSFSHFSFADTTAFGMTLGKTTKQEVIELYPNSKVSGTSQWTGGEMLQLNKALINFEGLKKIKVLFNDESKVVALFLIIDKSRFRDIHQSLSKKYKVVNKIIPHVGNSFVKYSNDNDIILLDSPHMSFEMELQYITEKELTQINEMMKKSENSKKEKEESLL